MRSTYLEDDVEILLKDITGMVEPQSTEEREKLIQKGKHYCEMLPIEYVPTEEYMSVYKDALSIFAKPTAIAIGKMADKIIEKKGKDVVLVSLARAGIPIGVLAKRFIKKKYQYNVPHYAISIIRGKGIDDNAMQFLLNRYEPEQIMFVDGWIGKGAILNELKKDLRAYEGVTDEIAVVADPANVTDLCGTHNDILIPSSCLNCTVSGLISRTFLRDDIIGKKDFHGAVFYENLISSDLSYEFIDCIEKEFEYDYKIEKELVEHFGMDEINNIVETFGIDDINFVKPGIGETTRVLLRRVPWKVLINPKDKNDRALKHIIRLAEEKGVLIEEYALVNYKCCGIIKKIADV
ncbi:MAG: cysteine protease StiP family protein [Lachnospiraceae bacterium]|nr:cysteine protease StiP family protein [Lachnospiraceae bacterium]